MLSALHCALMGCILQVFGLTGATAASRNAVLLATTNMGLAAALPVATRRDTPTYEKDEILQHYMNLIFWGGSIHGVEAASRAYLEKSAADLTLSESAMLAGIIFFEKYKTANKGNSRVDMFM